MIEDKDIRKFLLRDVQSGELKSIVLNAYDTATVSLPCKEFGSDINKERLDNNWALLVLSGYRTIGVVLPRSECERLATIHHEIKKYFWNTPKPDFFQKRGNS